MRMLGSQPGRSPSETETSTSVEENPHPENPKRPQDKFVLWLSDIHMDPYYGVDKQFRNDSAVCTFACKGCPTKFGPEDAAQHAYGFVGCDAPLSLWESALAAARKEAHDADVALFTGDFVRHHQNDMPDPWTDTLNTMGNVSDALPRAFLSFLPEDFVLGALGNDDSPRDYELNITTDRESNKWLSDAGGEMLEGGVMQHSRLGVYSYGGYFEAQM